MKITLLARRVPAAAPVALLIGGLFACSRPQTADAPGAAPLRVETAEAVRTTEPVPIEASGVLSRKAEALLSFKTSGVIAAIQVRAGDRVTRGQELASLRLDEIDAQVAQAEIGLEKARRDLARVGALQRDRVATLESLQDAQTAYDLAEAGLRAARFNREHSVIAAPDSGTILRRMAEPEELAPAGQPILAFAGDAGGWIVRTGIAEPDVLRLRLGDKAVVRNSDGASVAAAVSQIAEGADPATRTVETELRLEQTPPQGWRSGFLVEAVIVPQPVPARDAVPLSALIEGRGKSASVFVLAADGRSVHRVQVEVESIHRDTAYLATPLPSASRVVTSGAEFLKDGRAVIDNGQRTEQP